MTALSFYVPVAFAADAKDFMVGAPPAVETRVDKSNWAYGPHNRWGLQHVREITSTQGISKGDGEIRALPEKLQDIASISLETLDGKPGTISDWLDSSYTDGFLILHKGNIITETYMNSMTDDSYHNFFSMSKSFTGSLAGLLIESGDLDTTAKVAQYVPEMVGGAYAEATVRQLMDMTVGIAYSEDYDDPEADVFAYAASSNANPNPKGLTLYGVLPTFKKAGQHGEKFHYVTANTDALGWVLQRASGRDLAELLTTEIWSKIGAEQDAYVISDLDGTPWLGGGLNATLRDAGRFGLMMLHDGKNGNDQVIPSTFVDDVQASAIETGYPGVSYRSQWWVDVKNENYSAVGVAGQRILIAPEQDLVVVKFSSWPALSGYHAEGRAYDARALQAIIDHVETL